MGLKEISFEDRDYIRGFRLKLYVSQIIVLIFTMGYTSFETITMSSTRILPKINKLLRFRRNISYKTYMCSSY